MKSKKGNKMKLIPHGSNQNVLSFDNGIKVFFSYRTPVAAFHPIQGWLMTDEKYSRTTTKHVRAWLKGLTVTVVSQSEIDNLVEG
jgi:hypothetical protein